MTEQQIAAEEDRLAALSDDEVIAIWMAVDGDPSEAEELALGEIERRDLGL